MLHRFSGFVLIRTLLVVVVVCLGAALIGQSLKSEPAKSADKLVYGLGQVYGMTVAHSRLYGKRIDTITVIIRNPSQHGGVRFRLDGFKKGGQRISGLEYARTAATLPIELLGRGFHRWQIPLAGNGRVAWAYFSFDHKPGTTRYCITGRNRLCKN